MDRQANTARRRPIQFSLKFLLAVTAYFALLLGILVDYFAHRRYRAETLVVLRWDLPLLGGGGNQGSDAPAQPDCSARVRKELHRMAWESERVLTAAAERLQAGGCQEIDDAPSPTQWVRDRVEVGPHDAEWRIWQVAGQSRVDAQDALDVSRAVAEAYLEIWPTFDSRDEALLIEELARRCASRPALARELIGSDPPQGVPEIRQALSKQSRCPGLRPFGEEQLVVLAPARAAVLVAPDGRLAIGLALWAALVLAGIAITWPWRRRLSRSPTDGGPFTRRG
jgi:hypothetical protein